MGRYGKRGRIRPGEPLHRRFRIPRDHAIVERGDNDGVARTESDPLDELGMRHGEHHHMGRNRSRVALVIGPSQGAHALLLRRLIHSRNEFVEWHRHGCRRALTVTL